MTFNKGRHNLKMGVMIRRNDPNISDNPGCDFGCYGFDGSITGFDYADFLLGIPATTNRNFRAPSAYFRWTNTGVYSPPSRRSSSSSRLIPRTFPSRRRSRQASPRRLPSSPTGTISRRG